MENDSTEIEKKSMVVSPTLIIVLECPKREINKQMYKEKKDGSVTDTYYCS
jgi:hypothetical protein